MEEVSSKGEKVNPVDFQTLKNKVSEKKIYDDSDSLELVRQKIRSWETDRVGREKYYELRDAWSWFLRWLLTVMVLFQFLITAAIGFGLVDFIEYKTFLYAILVENFLQIVGMALIVVKFLFPNGTFSDNSKRDLP